MKNRTQLQSKSRGRCCHVPSSCVGLHIDARLQRYIFYLLFQCFWVHLAKKYSAFLPISCCQAASPGRAGHLAAALAGGLSAAFPLLQSRAVFPKALRTGNNLPISFFFFFPRRINKLLSLGKKFCVFIVACFPHYLQRNR